MSGTLEGGRKAAKTNRKLYGESFYRDIGRKGGQNGHTGGFASNPELASRAGKIGGMKSRRGESRLIESIIMANRENILEKMSMGIPIKRIAQDMGISYSTLRMYMRKVQNETTK